MFDSHSPKPQVVEGVQTWPQVSQHVMRHRGFTRALALVTPLGHVAGEHQLSQTREYSLNWTNWMIFTLSPLELANLRSYLK